MTKASREVILEKLHWSLAQVQENGKLTNILKSLINGHSKKFFPESPFTIQTHIFRSQKDIHLY